jgi:hypothetical protein
LHLSGRKTGGIVTNQRRFPGLAGGELIWAELDETRMLFAPVSSDRPETHPMRRKIKRTVSHLRSLWRHRRHLKNVVHTHLYFIENPNTSLWGGITTADEEGLRAAVALAAKYPGPIVEVGTLFGWTTQLLATLKAPERELISIDNYCWNPFCLSQEDHRAITHRSLRYCLERCNTSLFEGTTHEFYRRYRGATPSMVFIDADHSYRESNADIQWARDMGVPIITGHDYQALHPGVIQAVNEQFGKAFELHGSVWIAENKTPKRVAA